MDGNTCYQYQFTPAPTMSQLLTIDGVQWIVFCVYPNFRLKYVILPKIIKINQYDSEVQTLTPFIILDKDAYSMK